MIKPLRRRFPALCLLVLGLALAPAGRADEDEADMVVGCTMANAEFGNEMIQRCIEDYRAGRAAVASYPPQYKGIVDRCTGDKQLDWNRVRRCIDDDISAIPVLQAYAQDHGPLLERCEREIGGPELSRIRACVDKLVEAGKADGGGRDK